MKRFGRDAVIRRDGFKPLLMPDAAHEETVSAGMVDFAVVVCRPIALLLIHVPIC